LGFLTDHTIKLNEMNMGLRGENITNVKMIDTTSYFKGKQKLGKIQVMKHVLHVFIQGVPGGMCQTSGECSLGQTIPT